MIIQKKIVLVIACMFISPMLMAESFVAKKKKTVSTSTIKNNCADACTQTLELSAQLIESLADHQLTLTTKNNTLLQLLKHLSQLQQHMLSNIRAILEGKRDCFFYQADKNQLTTCCTNTTSCLHQLTLLHNKIKKGGCTQAQMRVCDEQIRTYITYIESL